MKKIRTYQTIIGILCVALAGSVFVILNQETDMDLLRKQMREMGEYVQENELNKEYQRVQATQAMDASASEACLLYTSPSPRD